MENILEIKNLCKKYKDFELKNINIELPKGMIMGLIGENGAKLRDSGVKVFNVREDVADNKVVVGIAGYTDEDIKKVKEVADVPFLKFVDWYER